MSDLATPNFHDMHVTKMSCVTPGSFSTGSLVVTWLPRCYTCPSVTHPSTEDEFTSLVNQHRNYNM